MLRNWPLLILIAFMACQGALHAQGQSYTSEYWEENWREWPRPRFDYRVDSFAAVESTVLREFFSSNSNISGEIYRHYVRFQYPNWEAVQEHGAVVFQLPNYEWLEDIDFRIWEEGLLSYEARAAAVKEYYLDTLSADPHTQKMFAFRLRFPELKPGQIVEVMISCKGNPLPYHLSFEQNFPVIKATQGIKILSAFPLRFEADSTISQSQERVYDYNIYKFTLRNIPAYPLETGLSTQPVDLPIVWLDWKDQIFFYDRDERDDWPQVLPYLFYEGDLKDFVVYRNSLAEDFGRQQFFSSWIRPVRYFHTRSRSFASNQAYAEGRWRLSKKYADIWLEVEEDLNRTIIDNEIRDFEVALQNLLEKQAQAVSRYLKELPLDPPVFTEYGLLCSHIEKLLEYFQYDYRLALLVPARNGIPKLDYASPWQANARAIAFRTDSSEAWRFIVPGPYLSHFFEPGRIPPDLHQGKALLFRRSDTLPTSMSLPPALPHEHGFTQVLNFKERKDHSRWIRRDSLHLRGVFQNIMASAYLRTDTILDQLSYSNEQLLYQAEQKDSLIVSSAESLEIRDTLIVEIPLHQALSTQVAPVSGRSFALPTLFEANWHFKFTSRDSLEFELPLPQEFENDLFRLQHRWHREAGGQQTLKLVLTLKKLLIPPEEHVLLQDLQALLRSDLKLKIWKRKSTEPGM